MGSRNVVQGKCQDRPHLGTCKCNSLRCRQPWYFERLRNASDRRKSVAIPLQTISHRERGVRGRIQLQLPGLRNVMAPHLLPTARRWAFRGHQFVRTAKPFLKTVLIALQARCRSEFTKSHRLLWLAQLDRALSWRYDRQLGIYVSRGLDSLLPFPAECWQGAQPPEV